MGSGVSKLDSSFPALYRISHRLSTPEQQSIWTATVSHSGKILVCTTGDFLIRVWSLDRFEQVHVIPAHDDAVWSLTFSPDDKLVVSTSADGTVKLFDPQTGEIKRTIRSQSNWVWSAAFNRDSSLLICGGTDACLYVYQNDPKTKSFNLKYSYKLHEKSISKLLFSSQDHSRIVSASADGTIAVFDVVSQQVVVRVEGHVGAVTSLALNPKDNHVFASCGEDTTVRLWDLRDLTVSLAEKSRSSIYGVNYPHHVLKGHKETVSAVVFNFSGELLLSAGRDKTVRVWILPEGYREKNSKTSPPPTQLAVIQSHGAWVQSTHWLGRNFSALLSVSTDGTIVAHSVPLSFWKDIDGRQVKVCKRELVTDTTWVQPLKHR
jgi:WD40 repeat protein